MNIEEPAMNAMKRSLRFTLGFLLCGVVCLALFSGCARIDYTPSKSSTYPAYQGKVILLTGLEPNNKVPGAEELAVIKVTSSWPWMSQAGYLRRWKKEAARHGANAVRWSGEGCGEQNYHPFTFASAKAYRIEGIEKPEMEKYWAKAYEQYNR
jgi:hypothetical protein